MYILLELYREWVAKEHGHSNPADIEVLWEVWANEGQISETFLEFEEAHTRYMQLISRRAIRDIHLNILARDSNHEIESHSLLERA